MGIDHVGLTMICFGVVNVVFSYIYGSLVKFIGRLPCFISGAIINYSLLIVMLTWHPSSEQTYVLYIITALWGLADAAWQTQVNCMLGFILCFIQLNNSLFYFF